LIKKRRRKIEKARTTEKEYHPNSQTKKRRHPILKEGRWPATAKRRKTSLLLGEIDQRGSITYLGRERDHTDYGKGSDLSL